MDDDNRITLEVSSVAQGNCKYKFQLRIEQGSRLNGGTITFDVDSLFNQLRSITGSNLTFDGQTGTWVLPSCRKNRKSAMFTAVYVGSSTGRKLAISNIQYTKNGQTTTIAQDYYVDVNEVCTSDITECCEESSTSDNYVETVVESCTDNTRIELSEENINLESTGRVLAVDISLPAVCDSKDVNIGVFVNEVLLDEDENEFEQPFAYKVIRFPADEDPDEECEEGRGCRCVEFMIDDDSPQCEARTFRVRTKAHYVLTEDTRCDCEE